MLEILEYFKNKEMNMPHEILLSGSNQLHYKASEIKDGFRIIEQSVYGFPTFITKKYYRGKKSDGGIAYEFLYSGVTNRWWVNIFKRSSQGLAAPMVLLEEPYTMTKVEENEQLLIIDIIKGMREFNNLHNVDIYKPDIEYLKSFLQDSKLYMIK